jgi:hypothetical protein
MTTSTIKCTDIANDGKCEWSPQRPGTLALNLAPGPTVRHDRATWQGGIVEYYFQLFADTVTLRDMYTAHRPETADPVLQKQHLLFDRHFAGQHALVDEISQNIRALGGNVTAAARDINKRTLIPHNLNDFQERSAPVSRLLQAHNIVLVVSRATIHELFKMGAEEPSISNIVRINESHVFSLVNFMALENQTSISSLV